MSDITWTNITVRLGDLKPWADNPRTSTKAQAKRILASFERFGQVAPIAVSPSLEVYDGHQRLSALLTIHGPDYVVDARQSSRPLTDDERRALVLALANATGQWNWDLLSSWSVDELNAGWMNTETLVGWNNDANNLKELLRAEKAEKADIEPEVGTDRAQELQEKWKVQKGELFLIGGHRLLCGDSTDADLLTRLFDGEKYDSMITDPPFFTPATHYQSRVKHQRKFSDLSSLASFWELVMDRTDVYRKREAHAAVFCNCDSYAVFYPVMFSRFDKTKSLVWNKMHVGLGRIFRHQHELIIWGRNEGHYFAPDGELHADVIACEATPSKDRDHPVEKPAKLYTALVSPLTPKGGITFDPFAGAGLICLAAEDYGCKAYAMELDPAYCAVILERMSQAFPALDIRKVE